MFTMKIADLTSHWWQQVLESTQRNSSLWIAGRWWSHLHASFTSRSTREQVRYWSSKQSFIFIFTFRIIHIFGRHLDLHPHIFIFIFSSYSSCKATRCPGHPEFLRLKLEREHGDDTSIEVSARSVGCRSLHGYDAKWFTAQTNSSDGSRLKNIQKTQVIFSWVRDSQDTVWIHTQFGWPKTPFLLDGSPFLRVQTQV